MMRESDLRMLIKLDCQAIRQRRNDNMRYAILLVALVLMVGLGAENVITVSHTFWGWGWIILAIFSGRTLQQTQSREKQYRQMLAYVIDTDPVLIQRYNQLKAE